MYTANLFWKHYPQYEHGKQTNDNGLILGRFEPTNKIFLQSKCKTCGQSQDWEKGNNYIKMWFNKDIYNLKIKCFLNNKI